MVRSFIGRCAELRRSQHLSKTQRVSLAARPEVVGCVASLGGFGGIVAALFYGIHRREPILVIGYVVTLSVYRAAKPNQTAGLVVYSLERRVTVR
jgi:hypothetical protein